MADNMNGEQMRAEAQRVTDQAKAAGASAAENLRESAYDAADAARSRARDASDWARSRFEDLQNRVEDRPQSAALWALGIGVVAGLLFSSLLRGRD